MKTSDQRLQIFNPYKVQYLITEYKKPNEMES